MRHLLLITWVICSFAFCTAISYAQTPNTVTPDSYTPIVGIPGINGNDVSTQQYINALYYMAISVACILAVYKIMEGGIKWMFDGLVTGKEEAKQQIQGAVFGLLIVLSAVLVLETINVNLTNINILGNAPSLNAIDRANGPQTQCQVDARSAACCIEMGGTYETTTGGAGVCKNADAGIGLTGNPDQDKVTCEQAGYKWDDTTNPNRCVENITQSFSYNSIMFISGKYSMPQDLYDSLDASQVQTYLETACLKSGGGTVSSAVSVGSNVQFTCQ